jgi:hypothetical protein
MKRRSDQMLVAQDLELLVEAVSIRMNFSDRFINEAVSEVKWEDLICMVI